MSKALNIQTKKLELIQWLSSLEDLSIIDKIMELRKRESFDFLAYKADTGDWADTLNEKEIALIQKGEADFKNGKTFSHAEAMKKINAHIKEKK